jgi:hypothetical protein
MLSQGCPSDVCMAAEGQGLTSTSSFVCGDPTEVGGDLSPPHPVA